MELIRVENLKKGFENVKVLTDVSFTVNKGDVIAVIGPSGAGKSTMLRCIINLEKMDGRDGHGGRGGPDPGWSLRHP